MSKRKGISKKVRFSVFARDEFTCVYCGRQPPAVVLNLEHVIPVSKGGTDDEANLRTACFDCNSGKGDREIGESVPTEADRLKLAQELAEQKMKAEAVVATMEAQQEFRQCVVDAICEVLGVEQIQNRTATTVGNLYNEFGAAKVTQWMEIAAHKTYRSEFNFIKYLCGIARRVRDEDK